LPEGREEKRRKGRSARQKCLIQAPDVIILVKVLKCTHLHRDWTWPIKCKPNTRAPGWTKSGQDILKNQPERHNVISRRGSERESSICPSKEQEFTRGKRGGLRQEGDGLEKKQRVLFKGGRRWSRQGFRKKRVEGKKRKMGTGREAKKIPNRS